MPVLCLPKMILVMKLTFFLTIAVFLQAGATGFSQQRITLSDTNASLEKVFKEIHKQSGYNFLYNDQTLAGASPVSIHVKDAALEDVLLLCMKDQPLSFDIISKTVVLKNKAAVTQPQPAAPPVTVSGRVTDASGTPLPGVNVHVKGANTGTSTNANGQFSLTVPDKDAVLQFTYVGFNLQEVVVGEKTTMEIRMQPTVSSLSDIVVIGYGQTQAKARVTGAISTLKGSEVAVTKNESVINMLTGKVPGMRILQKSSEPGAFDNNFDIRGFGSPLVVIDGVPRGSGDLARMDPNEIDNISVLKDATAAIYGVRAANGVILVTTRKGSRNPNGKFDITYNINQSWQQFLDAPKGVDALQFMMLKNEAQRRDFGQNYVNMTAPYFSDDNIKLYQDGTLKSSDWVAATMRDFAPETQHTLSVNGGSDKVNYFFNLGYFKQDGMFKSGDMNYNRWNFRSNINARITDRLRAQILTSAYLDTKNQPGGRGVWEMFKYTWSAMPTDQIYANNDPDHPHIEPDNANPVVITNSDIVGSQTYKNKNLQAQLGLEYDVPGVTGLTAKGMYNYGTNISDNTQIRKAYNLYDYDRQNEVYLPTLVNSPSTVNRGYWNNQSTLFQLSLNYNHRFAQKHNVSGLLLYEESYTTNDNFSAQRQFSLGIPYLFAGDDLNQQATQDPNGLNEVTTKAVVGRVGYDFNTKYILDFSFRYDASSKFKTGNQWGLFPAVSAGWRVSEENFMRSLVSPNVLSNLKLRASYGKTGDDGAAGFQYISGYNYPASGYIFGGNYVNGLQSRGAVNPDLTWYTATTLNMGVDVDLYKGLLGASFDYFIRNRDGLLDRRNATLPGTVGTALPLENLNSDRTKGYEITLSHRNRIGEFSYNVSANISSTRTMWVNKIETRAGNSYDNWKNQQSNRYTNIWWGKEYGGQYSSYDQIFNHNVNAGGGNQNVVPGDYWYQDLNHDGVIDQKDEVPIAVRDIPMVNYGVNIGAAWRGIDLNVLLQGATQFYVQYEEQMATPLMYNRSALVQFLDRWHTADPKADEFDPNTLWVPGYYPAMGSPIAEGTKAVQNASYMRIKTLELGYSLPHKLLSRAGIGNLRVYVNSYNLFTFTKLKNSDPEHPGKVANPSDPTQWNYSQGGYKYPNNRTFSVGANVTF